MSKHNTAEHKNETLSTEEIIRKYKELNEKCDDTIKKIRKRKTKIKQVV